MNDWNPRWTKPASWSLGRDPLGLQATSVRLYRTLLPGMTNVTNRLRYYSFYSWVVRVFELDEHSGDRALWARWIRRAEALYALASHAYPDADPTGMGGGRWALRRRGEGVPPLVDLRPWTDHHSEKGRDQYLAAEYGNFGQFYLASMQEVGLLAESTSIPLVKGDRGRGMAEAFAESVGTDIVKLLKSGIRNGIIARTDLEAVGAAAHPSKIPPGSNEMQRLRAYLLDEHTAWMGVKRRESAWLILDVMRLVGTSFKTSQMRNVFYNRTLPGGGAYEGNRAAAADTLDGWQAYQANELCNVALLALMNGLVKLLDIKGGKCQADKLADDMADYVLGISGGPVGTWSTWASEVGGACVGSEDELARDVNASIGNLSSKFDRRPGLGAAVKLLAALWVRWRGGENQIAAQVEKANRQNPDFPSVAGVVATLDRWAHLDRRNALAGVLMRHVVSEHMVIAGRKLSGAGSFTYHFTTEDGTIADGRESKYSYTNPRLDNLVTFLRDAGLHVGNAPTVDGVEFLDAR